jgi:hypothetical protein
MNTLQYTRLCIATLGVIIASTVAVAQTAGNSPRIDLSGVVPIAVDHVRTLDDTIVVVDLDLAAPGSSERVDITVLRPSWVEVAPSTLDAQEGVWSRQVALKYSRVSDSTGPHELVLVARDAEGNSDTVSTTVWVGETISWVVPAWVELTEASGARHVQRLMFGQARYAHERSQWSGRPFIDTSHGEIALPPLDPSRAFDARWTIDSSNGVVRSIEPETPSAGAGTLSYRCRLHGFSPTPGAHSDTLRIRFSALDMQERSVRVLLTTLNGDTRYLLTTPSWQGQQLPADRRTYVQLDSAWITVVTADSSFRDGFVLSLPIIGSVDAIDHEHRRATMVSHPTPFATVTTFTLETRAPSRARASVCDASGTVVRLLDDGDRIATRHTFEWDGRDEAGQALPSGVYFARAVAGDVVVSARAVLVR